MSQRTASFEAPSRKVLATNLTARKSGASSRPTKQSPQIERISGPRMSDLSATQLTDLFDGSRSPPDSPSQRSLAVKNDRLHRGSPAMSSARTNGIQPQPPILPSNHIPSSNRPQIPSKPRDAFHSLPNGTTRVSSAPTTNGMLPVSPFDKVIRQQSTPRRPQNRAPPAVNAVHGFGPTNGVNGVNMANGVNPLNAGNGISGANGLNPLNAAKGVNGLNGPHGLNGIHRINGINAINGVPSVKAVNGVPPVKAVNGVNGTSLSHTMNRSKQIPQLPAAPLPASTGQARARSAQPPAPLRSTPDANRTKRLQTTPIVTKHDGSLQAWLDEQRNRDDTEIGSSYGTPVSRWNGQMSESLSVTRAPEEVSDYVNKQLSERVDEASNVASQPHEGPRIPDQRKFPAHQPSALPPAVTSAIASAAVPAVGPVADSVATKPKSRSRAKRQPKQKPSDLTKPPVEQERLRRVEDFSQADFDACLYNQSEASEPPQNVLVPPPPVPSCAQDSPSFLHIDPLVHYTRPLPPSWLKNKQEEIKARGSKKDNFGKAAERTARKKRKQDDVPLEDKVPDVVRFSDSWMRAQQWFTNVDQEVQEGYKQQASLRLQKEQAEQIQEQLEREAAQTSS